MTNILLISCKTVLFIWGKIGLTIVLNRLHNTNFNAFFDFYRYFVSFIDLISMQYNNFIIQFKDIHPQKVFLLHFIMYYFVNHIYKDFSPHTSLSLKKYRLEKSASFSLKRFLNGSWDLKVLQAQAGRKKLMMLGWMVTI